MTRQFASLLAATALAACSSDPNSRAEPATSAWLTQGSAASLSLRPLNPEPVAPDALALASPVERDIEPSLPGRALLQERPEPETAPAARAARANSCDILVQRVSNGVMLKAVARLSASAAGDYSFLITKSGGGGSSDINQGGPFEGRAGERIALGAAEMSTGRNASWRATLILTSHGAELCRRTVRS